jgi:hypothetical protein
MLNDLIAYAATDFRPNREFVLAKP